MKNITPTPRQFHPRKCGKKYLLKMVLMNSFVSELFPALKHSCDERNSSQCQEKKKKKKKNIATDYKQKCTQIELKNNIAVKLAMRRWKKSGKWIFVSDNEMYIGERKQLAMIFSIFSLDARFDGK